MLGKLFCSEKVTPNQGTRCTWGFFSNNLSIYLVDVFNLRIFFRQRVFLTEDFVPLVSIFQTFCRPMESTWLAWLIFSNTMSRLEKMNGLRIYILSHDLISVLNCKWKFSSFVVFWNRLSFMIFAYIVKLKEWHYCHYFFPLLQSSCYNPYACFRSF